MAAHPLVTAFARQWSRASLDALERRILDAITTNLAESVTITGESSDGRSTQAVIGATLEQRQWLLGIVQQAMSVIDGTATAGAGGLHIDFSQRVTGT